MNVMGADPTGMTGYLAAVDRLDDLLEELGEECEVHDRLVLAPGPRRPAVWAANVWLDPVRIHISSINEAAKALRSIQRDWAWCPFGLHRRAALITEKLPRLSIEPSTFPAPYCPRTRWSSRFSTGKGLKDR